MERLTDKYGTTKCDNVTNVLKNGTTNKFVIGGKAIAKLKEFEDFMEEQGFESLENLKTHINKINKYELGIRKQFVKEINEEDFFDMKDENQALKDRWQKLKEYAEYTFNLDKCNLALAQVLNKMQELEKEIK